MSIIVQFTDKSVELYKKYERVSIDYPILILDFDLPTQRTYRMDTQKRQTEIVQEDNIILWSILDHPFTIDNEGNFVEGEKPKRKVYWVDKVKEKGGKF